MRFGVTAILAARNRILQNGGKNSMPKALLDTGVWFGYFDEPEIVKLQIKNSRVIRC